jgi:hypothetical protein
MADLNPIKFPDELRNHNLTEQELAPLTPQQQALAKDWNVIKRQIEWTMGHVVTIHNLMVEHDRALETWKLWLKVGGFLVGGGSGVAYVIVKLINGGGS